MSVFLVRPIDGYPGYAVANTGEVFTRDGRRMKPWHAGSGYLQVGLRVRPTIRVKRYVHHLVLEAFRGPRPDGQEARHLDGNRVNNRLENLAWGTHVENLRDQVTHGTALHGERHPSAKLSENDVREIRALLGKRVPKTEIARRFGVSGAAIHMINSGRTWRNVGGEGAGA